MIKCEKCDIELELCWNRTVGRYFYCPNCGETILPTQLPTDGKEWLKGVIKEDEKDEKKD